MLHLPEGMKALIVDDEKKAREAIRGIQASDVETRLEDRGW